MTTELAQRLLQGGAPAASIEAALATHALQGSSFVHALLECSPELRELIEAELARVPEGTPEIHVVRPCRKLLGRLPDGSCERLLAVPLRQDAEGVIDVAAVDVFDPYVAEELDFHLDAPLRFWRAELAALRQALLALRTVATSSETTVESRETAVATSQTMPPSEASARVFPSRVPTLRPERRWSSNPPIPLTRQPQPPPVFSLTRTRVHLGGGFRFDRSVQQALQAFELVESAEAVAQCLIWGFEPADALVLAVHRDLFEVRSTSGSLGPQRVPLGIPAGRGSFLDQAVRAGAYLGPIAPTPVDAQLRARLGETVSEVHARSIRAAGRPVFVLVVARSGHASEAAERAERLGQEAERTLERIVRFRRQQARGA